jgi:phosphoglycerate dehydrogenase-like enzyme
VLAGHLSAATLDVFDTEPLPPGDPIWTTPGIMVTPHVSGELADWQTHAAMLFSDNLAAWTAGRPLQNLCEPTRGY